WTSADAQLPTPTMARRMVSLVSSGTLLLGRRSGRRHGRGGAVRAPRDPLGPGSARGAGTPDLTLLGLDQIVQPPDVGLGGGELMVHERQRVAVDPLLVDREGSLQIGPATLQIRPATLQQADPRLRLEVLEEGQADAEPVVTRGLVAGALK